MVRAYAKKMVLPTILMIWATTYYIECQSYNLKSRRLVTWVFFIMLALFIINGITDFLQVRRNWIRKSAEEKRSISPDWKALAGGPAKRTASIFGTLILYVLLLEPIGFVLTTFVGSAVILFEMEERNWLRLLIISALLTAMLYVAFKTGLRIPLPGGLLGW